MIEIKLFAYLSEKLGPQISCTLPETITKQSLLALLAETHPELSDELKHCNVAVNQTFISEQAVFFTTDIKELAIIPPVSGG